MSQSMQEPPNDDRFAPPSAYEQRQSPTRDKGQVDLSALVELTDTFEVPPYLVSHSDPTPSLNKAVAELMAEMEWVQKRGKNKFFNYQYATADDLRELVAHFLGRHGLSYEQHEVSFLPLGTLVGVVYLFRVCHESGEKGPYERRTVWTRILSEKGSADDKAISKACVLALKDWTKTRFSIPTGEDQEPAGGDDPDSDQYTDVKPNQRTQAPSKGQGSTTNLRDHVRAVQGGKPAQDGQTATPKAGQQEDPEASAKQWVENLVNKVRLGISANPENARDAVSAAVATPKTQDFVHKLRGSQGGLRKVYDDLVRALMHPDVFPHTGNLSSVFPDLHKDITDAHQNGKAG